MKKYLAYLLLLCPCWLLAQKPTQNIRGIVIDKQTQQVLVGATITVQNTNPKLGAVSDEKGAFVVKNVPVGRASVQVQYIGYEAFTLPDVILQSTREQYLTIALVAGAIAADEVVISASKNAFEPQNDLSVVSTRSFTAEETERIPAGVNDPGRVALSYPGVQRGQDDTENQIVVRGNSPVGILWRLEGIDIPNPNHFAVVGSSGGGITVFSAQLLAKSDFSTGGFAAEYGNALSGAFDVRFRNGDFEKRENRFRLGVLGIDLATEGPINKGQSSYLVNYRYSTLGLLSSMGIYLVGDRVTNNFQDLSFNLVFRNKNQKSIHTVFGIGGLSEEHYLPIDAPEKRKLGVANNWEDRVRPANMGTLGWTWTYLPNSKSYLKTVVALVGSEISRQSDTLNLKNERYRYDTQRYIDKRLVASLTYSRKLTDQTLFKTGLIFNHILFDFLKETKPTGASLYDINQLRIRTSVKGSGNTQMFQTYAQVSHALTDRLDVNAGVHLLHLFANQTSSVEPRLSLQYKPAANQRISLAYGLHGRALPLMAYYFRDSVGNDINKNLKLLKAHHLVLAYHLYTQTKMRFSLETYAQKLFNVPIRPDKNATYWMLNNSGEFPEFKTVSQGVGFNYGIDAAVEKLFSNAYFFLVTGSLLDANYQTLTGIRYNSRFNTRFSSSYTFGKEFAFRRGGILQIGGRFLLNGGFRYTPHDPVLSKQQKQYMPKANAEYEGQVPAYQRLDTRIAYRFNKSKIAGNISLDFQNALNKINATNVGYNPITNETFVEYRSSGFVPILTIQLDF